MFVLIFHPNTVQYNSSANEQKLQITQGREMYKRVPYTSDLSHGNKYGTQWCMLFNTTSAECSRTVNKIFTSGTLSDSNGIKGWAQVPIYAPLNPKHTNLMPALSECYSPSKTPPVTKTMTHTATSMSMRTIHATQVQTIIATVTAHWSVLSAGEDAGISIASILGALLFFALGVLGTLTFLFLRARPQKLVASQEAAATDQGDTG